MARECPVTKKKSIVGGGYSNRTRATKYNHTGKVRKQTNLQKKRIYVPELGRAVSARLSTAALRTINRKGAYAVLKEAGLI